ncbi:MAG: DUF4105 domain-containing protein [Opitutaceae bacterium]|nr:DUF4105 domain-containing protein [Opitutaceae bacterium]
MNASKPSATFAHAALRLSRRVLAGLLVVVLGAVNLWALAALAIDVSPSWPAWVLTAGYGLGVLLMLWNTRGWLRLALAAACPALVVAWWSGLRPSNARDWQPDVAVLPYGEIAGDLVTLRNIRDCDYRTASDYELRHYDRTFDLTKLRTVDLFQIHWGSPDIAHPMISFGFENGDHVCVSIETRKEKGEAYSTLKGFFRRYELAYVFADERDVVRLRTNYRQGEDVYLYRLRATEAQARTLFLDYVRRAGELRADPEWYNAATSNCTTAIRAQRAVADRQPWDWRMLVNGRLDALFYERGMIQAATPRPPFAAVKTMALINEESRAADRATDFSRRIRAGIESLAAR